MSTIAEIGEEDDQAPRMGLVPSSFVLLIEE